MPHRFQTRDHGRPARRDALKHLGAGLDFVVVAVGHTTSAIGSMSNVTRKCFASFTALFGHFAVDQRIPMLLRRRRDLGHVHERWLIQDDLLVTS
jgi:hypothetical protein